MLILCPDCKRQLSDDIATCPKCGCNIARRKEEGFIFEVPVHYHHHWMSIVSAVMIPVWFFGYMFSTMGIHDDSILGRGLIIFAYLIVQLLFGIIPIVTDDLADKILSICGIVGSLIGMAIEFFVLYMVYVA